MTIHFWSDSDLNLMVAIPLSFLLKTFFCSKNSWVNLNTLRRSIVVYKGTVHFETVRLRFVLCRKSLVKKIVIVCTVQFNSFNFEWAIYSLVYNSSPYQYPIITLLPSFSHISELDKIHPLAHLSGPSNVTQDLFVKITLEMSIFKYFLAQIWCLKYLL